MSDVSSYDVSMEFAAGSFTNVTNDVINISIVSNLGDMISGFGAGEIDVELNNQQGKYSSGALSSFIRPNLPVRVKATHTGSTRQIFDGFVDEWESTPTLDQPRNIILSGRDSWKILQKKVITTSLRINTDIGSLFTQVMSQSNVSSFFVGEVSRNIPFFFLRDHISFSDAIGVMLGITHAYFYVCPENCVRIENRYFDALATIADSMEDSGKCGGLKYALSDDNTFNSITVETVPRDLDTAITSISAIDQPIIVPAGGTANFTLNFIDPENREQVPATDPQTPVASQDWFLSPTDTGAGDITSTASITTVFTSTSVETTVFNGSDTLGYLTRFFILGKPISRLSPGHVTIDVLSSQALYTTLELTHSNELIGGIDDARDMTVYLKNRYQYPRPEIGISFRNDFPRMLDVGVGARVHLVSSFMDVSSDFVVRGIEHSISAEDGWIHDTQYILRPIRELDAIILDNSSLGILDGTRTAVY